MWGSDMPNRKASPKHNTYCRLDLKHYRGKYLPFGSVMFTGLHYSLSWNSQSSTKMHPKDNHSESNFLWNTRIKYTNASFKLGILKAGGSQTCLRRVLWPIRFGKFCILYLISMEIPQAHNRIRIPKALKSPTAKKSAEFYLVMVFQQNWTPDPLFAWYLEPQNKLRKSWLSKNQRWERAWTARSGREEGSESWGMHMERDAHREWCTRLWTEEYTVNGNTHPTFQDSDSEGVTLSD